MSFDRIPTYPEATPIWTCYNDGVAVSVCNITVGSGATVTTTELKIAPSSKAVLGNPQFSRPLAICFGEASGTVGKFEEIRPQQYDEIIPAPGFLSGYNIIRSQCYVLPTGALYDGVANQPAFYRFYIRIQAKAGTDPNVSDSVNVYLLDKTYYKDDNQVWQSGWGAEFSQKADTDIGMDAIANKMVIYFA